MSCIAIPASMEAAPAAAQPLLEAVQRQLGVADTDIDFPSSRRGSRLIDEEAMVSTISLSASARQRF